MSLAPRAVQHPGGIPWHLPNAEQESQQQAGHQRGTALDPPQARPRAAGRARRRTGHTRCSAATKLDSRALSPQQGRWVCCLGSVARTTMQGPGRVTGRVTGKKAGCCAQQCGSAWPGGGEPKPSCALSHPVPSTMPRTPVRRSTCCPGQPRRHPVTPKRHRHSAGRGSRGACSTHTCCLARDWIPTRVRVRDVPSPSSALHATALAL